PSRRLLGHREGGSVGFREPTRGAQHPRRPPTISFSRPTDLVSPSTGSRSERSARVLVTSARQRREVHVPLALDSFRQFAVDSEHGLKVAFVGLAHAAVVPTARRAPPRSPSAVTKGILEVRGGHPAAACCCRWRRLERQGAVPRARRWSRHHTTSSAEAG